MGALKGRFQPHLGLTDQAICPQSHCIDRLARLPSESLIQICHLLSSVDLVCFCLCNHRLHSLFRANYRFPTLRSDRLSIFIRLERDLPEYFACDVCNFLHRYDGNGSESFGISGLVYRRSNQLPCVRKGFYWQAEFIAGSSISIRSHSGFAHARSRVSFLHIKLAMRRYLYGPRSGINTDSLAFTQVFERGHPWKQELLPAQVYRNIRLLFSIDAQICPEPLGVHIRMQDIVVYDLWEDSKIENPAMPHPMWSYEICRHTPLKPQAPEIESVYNGECPSFSFTCQRCNTVALIEFRRVNSRAALVMTRWINVGAGIDRDDPLWKIHSWAFDHATMRDKLPSSLKLQSPRKCFESTASLSFQDLRSRNISYLRDDRYKKGKPFDYEKELCFWHISYKEPSEFH